MRSSFIINDDNYIGIIGFDSDVREYLPIDQFSLTQKTLYKGAVNSLDANGNTAMYNGLCVAMDRIYKCRDVISKRGFIRAAAQKKTASTRRAAGNGKHSRRIVFQNGR